MADVLLSQEKNKDIYQEEECKIRTTQKNRRLEKKNKEIERNSKTHIAERIITELNDIFTKHKKIHFVDKENEKLKELSEHETNKQNYFQNLQTLLEAETTNKITEYKIKKELLIGINEGFFAIADNFVSKDIYHNKFRNTKRKNIPVYASKEIADTGDKHILLLNKIQKEIPGLIKETGVLKQIKESIKHRRLKIKKNVKNGKYNPYTRENIIKRSNILETIAELFKEDEEVAKEIIKIIKALLQQKHQDGTNSASFKRNIYNIIAAFAKNNTKISEKKYLQKKFDKIYGKKKKK